MSRILVTGATGQIGQALIPLLLRHQETVRMTTRGASRLDPDWWPPDVGGRLEVCEVDFDRPAGWSQALAGIETLFLLSPTCAEQVARERRVLEEAEARGIGRVVRLSVLGANPKSDVGLGRQHGRLDADIESSSFDYAIVRPHYFMQNFREFVALMAHDKCLHTSAGDGAFAMIHVADIAAVCDHLLRAPRLGRAVHSLTGPEAVSFPEALALLAQASGASITHVPCDRARAETELRRAGFSEWIVDSHATLFEHYRKGRAARVFPDFENLMGRPATSFRDYARDLGAAWPQASTETFIR